ncbi:MAG: MFS transporter [Oscillospiraceae bacterium]|nr:MFS transporter [Oscillospiraceae bacterium]
MKKLFQMYGGLRREIYILCFGRFVTAMGSLIWPMLTLILKSKLDFDAEGVALWFLVFSVLQLPFSLLGGRLTDAYNKRDLILLFDLISVGLYLVTACLPLSTVSIVIYFAGSLFQGMEWPAYDALIAELTSDHDREKAYSLQYLASNLGVVFAPTIGGLLFNNYLWLSFLISGLAVLSSTVLIFLYIPKEPEKAKITNAYESKESGSVLQVLKTRKILLVYLLISCISAVVYAQFNYLLPIQMDEVFLTQGAVLFGMLTSINGFVVILCTPLLTQLTLKWADLDRIRLGTLLELLGLCAHFFFGRVLVLYIVSMVVFTLGEILNTLGTSPYISKRIPATHRGRVVSVSGIFTTLASSLGNAVVGGIIVRWSFRQGWIFVAVIGAVLMLLLRFYRAMDAKRFCLLYAQPDGNREEP